MSSSPSHPSPTLDLIATLTVTLDPPIVIGETSMGLRRIIPIIGGTVEGPVLRGDVIGIGGDWNTWHAASTTGIAEAKYAVRTHDGVVIDVVNNARHTIPDDDEPIYTHPVLTAPEGPYAWLNHVTLLGTLRPGPDGDRVELEFWRVGQAAGEKPPRPGGGS